MSSCPPPRIAIVLVVLFACTVGGSSAEASRNVAVDLLSERASVEPGRPFYVGLRMRMRPGWHTYWKNPGDSGLPLRVTWSLPEGFSARPIEWPAPERIPEDGLMSYGYRGDVLLPVEILPAERFEVDSITITGAFEWLECADVCLPASSTLRVSLPVRPGPPAPGPDAPAFVRARSRIPAAPAGWAFTAEAGPRAISLEFRGPRGISPRGAYFFVDQPLVADHAAPQGFEHITGGYRVSVPPAPNAQGTLERLTGVLVVEDPSGSRTRTAVEVDVPVRRGDPAPAPVRSAETRPPIQGPMALIAVAGIGLAIVVLRSIRAGRKKAHPRREPNG